MNKYLKEIINIRESSIRSVNPAIVPQLLITVKYKDIFDKIWVTMCEVYRINLNIKTEVKSYMVTDRKTQQVFSLETYLENTILGDYTALKHMDMHQPKKEKSMDKYEIYVMAEPYFNDASGAMVAVVARMLRDTNAQIPYSGPNQGSLIWVWNNDDHAILREAKISCGFLSPSSGRIAVVNHLRDIHEDDKIQYYDKWAKINEIYLDTETNHFNHARII